MDEYSKEITDLEAQVEAMVEAEGDAREIVELEMQLELLKAIYAQARRLHDAGDGDRELRRGLAIRGYGAWTLDNVYAYVYETAVELPVSGHHAFVAAIRETDFSSRLLAAGSSVQGPLTG